FLLNTTSEEKDLQTIIQEIKDEHFDEHEQEITAGNNIHEQTLAAAQTGLGTPTALREAYQELTKNPREAGAIFTDVSAKYDFSELQKVFKFFFHSLGADLNSGGPSIPPGLIYRLISETRNLQAILGVYRFFKKNMLLIRKLFKEQGEKEQGEKEQSKKRREGNVQGEQEDDNLPSELTFESISKEFMALVNAHRASGAAVSQLAGKLGISDSVAGQIIVFSRMRDAVREVSPRIYRQTTPAATLEHRNSVFTAILEALDDLEDRYEEMMNAQEKEDDKE
ncbi:MAG: hypothetical protein WCF65_09365, partial [Parachlamydiaceae bacterium]